MKRLLLKLLLCVSLVIGILGFSVTSYAQSVDTEKPCSYTVVYKHGNDTFEGLEIKVYRIAEVSAEGVYSLADGFKDYPVKLNGVTSQDEWRAIASTLAAYIAADGIEPTEAGITDSDGKIVFSDIKAGMYLTLSVTTERDSEVTRFETFLTAIPYPENDGIYSYDALAYPKFSSYVPTPDETEHRVVKQWKDTGYADSRPEFVEVDILKNGIVESTQRLTADNNWSYSWKAPNDGAVWQAVERNVSPDYTVTVIESGSTIIVTNVHNYDGMNAPQTGNVSVVWPYALAMCFAGSVLMIVAVWRRKTEGRA